jgi:hypothetical protein
VMALTGMSRCFRFVISLICMKKKERQGRVDVSWPGFGMCKRRKRSRQEYNGHGCGDIVTTRKDITYREPF